ncbi:MAG: hypothetical protein U0324_34825 [Polyangiales bacterium]
MKRSKVLRAAFVVTVVGAAMEGCSLTSTDPPTSGGDASCPMSAPMSGEACSLPEETTCSWGGVPCPPWGPSGPTGRCVGGRWSVFEVSCNPPRVSGDGGDVPTDEAPPQCPSSVPTQGASCDARLTGPCNYTGAPCPPFGGAPISASCTSTGWQVTEVSCNPPPDVPLDAVDATADVDATTDADASSAACPATAPAAGDPCARLDATPCSYTVPCPGNLPISIQVVCAHEVWQVVTGAACNPPLDAGVDGTVLNPG